jgi:hypothetical protein
MYTPPMEHLFFEDIIANSISEDNLAEINDLYNRIVREPDHNGDSILFKHTNLLNVGIPKCDPTKIKLELRKTFHREVFKEVITRARSMYDNCRELTKDEMMFVVGYARNMVEDHEIAKITLEKYNSILDNYDDELSIATIAQDIIDNF